MAHGWSPARYLHLWYTGMKSIEIPSQSLNQNELLAANKVLFWQGHTKLRSATPVEAVLLVVTLSTSWSKFSKVLHFIRLKPLEEIRGSMKGNKNHKSHKCMPKCQCNAWNLCIAVIHRKHSWPSARVSSPVWLSFRPIVTFGSLSFLPLQVIARSWRCFPGRRSNDRPWPPVGAEAVRCNEGPAARWSALGVKCAGRICRARNKTFGYFWYMSALLTLSWLFLSLSSLSACLPYYYCHWFLWSFPGSLQSQWVPTTHSKIYRSPLQGHSNTAVARQSTMAYPCYLFLLILLVLSSSWNCFKMM